MNYSTLADIDAYAVSSGDYQFVESDNIGATARVNNAGGYNAAATSIAIDTLSLASSIQRYSVLYIGTEYLLVTATPTYTTPFTSTTLTVSRGMYGSTAATIADDALITVKDNRKVRCQGIATDDILTAMGKHLEDALWGENSSYLIEAEKVQTIWINRHLEERETAELAGTISQSNYNDGVLSISAPAVNGLCKKARQLVNEFMKIYGGQSNAFKRG